tara:strand:+ start:17 stop:277 length:261 start_codon:yes stop_codon:yes gene_type:complete
MKKVLFTLGLITLAVVGNSFDKLDIEEQYLSADCFDEAIEYLEETEATLGFTLPQDQATDLMNVWFASCYCLSSESRFYPCTDGMW